MTGEKAAADAKGAGDAGSPDARAPEAGARDAGSVYVNDLPEASPQEVDVKDLPPAPSQPSGGGPGGKPNPEQKPNPMNYYFSAHDYYPNPEDPNAGGGGPRSVGISIVGALGAFGAGVAALTARVGASSYQIGV